MNFSMSSYLNFSMYSYMISKKYSLMIVPKITSSRLTPVASIPKYLATQNRLTHGARLKTSLHLFQSTASDASSSWEAVDEKESKPTLWVPDHAAQTCASCHTAFWFGRRKHHCRNCGGVFCRSGHLLNSYYV